MGQGNAARARLTALVVEREARLRARLGDLLAALPGVEATRTASLGRARRLMAQSGVPDILLVGFDRAGACDLIAHAKALRPDCRLVVADAVADADSAAEAFAAGADDVIRPPFPPRELAARLRIPPAGEAGPDPVLARLPLTPVERSIMALLLQRRGEIVTRDEIARAVDRGAWVYGDRKFDVHIAKIRRKLAEVFGDRFAVRTIRSAGYFLLDSDLA